MTRQELLTFLKKEKNKQGIVRLGLREIAKELGTSTFTVSIILGELQGLGRISIQKKAKSRNIIQVL